MEKNKKTGSILSVIIAVLLLAYVVTMTLPFITYSVVDSDKLSAASESKKVTVSWILEDDALELDKPEFALEEKKVSLMQYLWTPYNYTDLTGDALPAVFKAEGFGKYMITDTIWIPLFAFLVAFISIAIVLIFKSKYWNVIPSFIWALVSLVGYFVAPIFTFMNSSSKVIHIILFALVLVCSVVKYILNPAAKKEN